jgi:phosphatidate cytidylyltransferase
MVVANDVTVRLLADLVFRSAWPRIPADLPTRTLSALVAAPVAIAAAWFGTPWFELLVALVLAAGAREWIRLCGLRLRTGGFAVWLAPLASVLAGAFAEPFVTLPVLAIAILVGLLQDSARNSAGVTLGRWATLGAAALGTTAFAAMYLRIWVPDGAATILWLFAVVWASDIGAYFTGRAFGGPKLAPRISPAKTWSGLIGGLLLAAVVGAVGGALKADGFSFAAVVIALAVASASVGGDLFESFVKRRFHAKDSGSVIPGHGGVLDRIDGLLTAAPVLAMIAALSSGDPVTWQ